MLLEAGWVLSGLDSLIMTEIFMATSTTVRETLEARFKQQSSVHRLDLPPEECSGKARAVPPWFCRLADDPWRDTRPFDHELTGGARPERSPSRAQPGAQLDRRRQRLKYREEKREEEWNRMDYQEQLEVQFEFKTTLGWEMVRKVESTLHSLVYEKGDEFTAGCVIMGGRCSCPSCREFNKKERLHEAASCRAVIREGRGAGGGARHYLLALICVAIKV